MNEKQERFVQEYLIDLNATQAAIRAGYSPKCAAETGYKLCHKRSVAKAIARAKAERSRRTGINADRVLLELARIAFVNTKDVIDFNNASIREDVSGEDISCVAYIKVRSIPTKYGDVEEREIKLHDKLKALELLIKHLGISDGKAMAEDESDTGVVEIPAVLPPERPPEEGAPHE